MDTDVSDKTENCNRMQNAGGLGVGVFYQSKE